MNLTLTYVATEGVDVGKPQIITVDIPRIDSIMFSEYQMQRLENIFLALHSRIMNHDLLECSVEETQSSGHIHNDLPTYEDCVEIERRSTMKTDMKWNKKREMKIEFGKRMAWHSKTVVAEVDESEEDGDEDLPPQDDMEDEEVEKEIMGTRTLHDANDVQMDVPMHADLNSTSVTVGIMRMTENYMYKALSKPNPHVDEEDTIAMIEERLKIEREKKRSMGARIQ